MFPIPVVGLTGGIASGKSTVAGLLGALGAPVVDADALAREAVLPGSPALTAIVERFGASVLGPDGTLDRAALAERVFGGADARIALEAIVHPIIARLAAERVLALAAAGRRWAVYEAALLVETGFHAQLPALVVVDVPRDVQRARLVLRDGLSAEAAEARLAAQLPLAKKRAVATHVVDNGGSREATAAAVRAVFAALVARFGMP